MFPKGSILIIGFILITICYKLAYSRVRFTNVVCKCVDPTFCTVERCDLIAVSRDSKNISLKAVLLQLPITDFELRIKFMKRANGWKPFLYDLTIKCNFTKHLNTVTRMVWNTVRNYSNVKHDCPYNQNLETINLNNAAVENALHHLPVPEGEYAIFTTWKSLNITRGILNFYGAFY